MPRTFLIYTTVLPRARKKIAGGLKIFEQCFSPQKEGHCLVAIVLHRSLHSGFCTGTGAEAPISVWPFKADWSLDRHAGRPALYREDCVVLITSEALHRIVWIVSWNHMVRIASCGLHLADCILRIASCGLHRADCIVRRIALWDRMM